MIRLIRKLSARNASPSPRRGEGQGGGRKPTSLAARWHAHRHRVRSARRGLHRRGRAKWVAAALATLPCFLLLSVNPSEAVAALRARAELRRQTIAMAERMGLPPEAVLDPIGYQRKLARAAEKERELQVFWMRQRTAPDELALNAHRRDVQETQDNYAIHELAAILEDLTELDRSLTDLEAGTDTTHRIVALERASLRHWEEVLDRYDAAMKRKLRTALREAQRRHDAFVRDTRTRLARIAGHVARATDARGVGEPANLRTQKPIDKKRLARIRPDVAKIAGTRSGLVRPPRPAVRGPREIVPAPRRSVALGDRTVDPDLLESATRRFLPSTGQKAAGLMRSFAGGAAPGMAPLPLHTAALLLRGGVLPLFLPPGAADTQPTLDAPHTPEIVALASDLGHEPIRIFNFVHDTIDTEIYLGSRKGAAGTLAERAGNDVDQASLLVALLRASGIPARYERVVIRLAPDQWKAYTGVNDVDQAASMLATVGLPAVITDIPDETGQIVSHIDTPIMAVRAYVPFADYRGHDTGHGGASAWAPLLPSLKAYATADAVDLRPGAIFDFDAYLSQLTTESPLEVWEAQLRAYILAQGIDCETLASAQPTRTIIPENLPYLRAELPATELSSLGALAEVPDTMRDRVRLTIRQPNGPLVLEHTATLVELYGSRIDVVRAS